MTTIKSYTDLEQSRKLAKILNSESADYFHAPDAGIVVTEPYKLNEGDETVITAYKGAIPCWSLAALLKQLKSEIQLENKQILFLHINKYDDIDYEIRYTNSWTGEVFITETDNPIDACVAMIEKLHELNLL